MNRKLLLAGLDMGGCRQLQQCTVHAQLPRFWCTVQLSCRKAVQPSWALLLPDTLYLPSHPCRHVPPMGTSVWGCMAARSGRFEETADLYSLSAVGAEVGPPSYASLQRRYVSIQAACLICQPWHPAERFTHLPAPPSRCGWWRRERQCPPSRRSYCWTWISSPACEAAGLPH